jgi:hypothetical protein
MFRAKQITCKTNISIVISTLESSGGKLWSSRGESVWDKFSDYVGIRRHSLEGAGRFGMVHGAPSDTWERSLVAQNGTCSWPVARWATVCYFTFVWLPGTSFFLDGWKNTSESSQLKWKENLNLMYSRVSESVLHRTRNLNFANTKSRQFCGWYWKCLQIDVIQSRRSIFYVHSTNLLTEWIFLK